MAKDNIAFTLRIRQQDKQEKFNEASERLEDMSRKYGKNATALFLMSLGMQKLEELDELEQEVSEAIPE